ncbi:MAG: alcohol dehydrogenase catalytic domain-containing protein [Candidatus Promineifilaceae bacterium]
MSFENYQALNTPLPDETLAWNMYGKGIENIGRNGEPESFTIPEPNDDQMLVRVDSVGMCFSDVKLIRQGRKHPKLYNRDLTQEPTRLGHEACITVIEVGSNLQERYSKGDRLAVQPDIYQNGKSTAYGYTIPGGLIQYHLMGKEMLETDAGACLLPLDDSLGYAETALLEPWGCVMAAYTQRRRLTPKAGGTLWIRGGAADSCSYQFSQYLDRPSTIILTDVSAAVEALCADTGATIVRRDGVEDVAALSAEFTNGAGFDDIVLLDMISAELIGNIAKHIARRGTLNLVGTRPLDGTVSTDVGRLHYDYIAFIGTNGTDIAASYGEARNRCELASNGVAVIVGAGGPMGQMHVQRALELPDGPQLIIATEINNNRLDAIQSRFADLAAQNERRLLTFNPIGNDQSLHDFVMRETDQAGADDVVICVPVAGLMEEGATLMNENGMLNLFAGVPNGTQAPIDISNIYLNNVQLTGTSGLTIDDQADVMARALAGTLSPSRSVAAIGGINAAKDGIEAMMEGRFPGKIVIFPQISDLPLLGLDELEAQLPAIAEHLGPNAAWTPAAEKALIAQHAV